MRCLRNLIYLSDHGDRLYGYDVADEAQQGNSGGYERRRSLHAEQNIRAVCTQ